MAGVVGGRDGRGREVREGEKMLQGRNLLPVISTGMPPIYDIKRRHMHPPLNASEKFQSHSSLSPHVSIRSETFSATSVIAAPLFCARFFNTFSINASPALYELRTNGPLAQYRNPISSARCRHLSNTAGATYSWTFMCRFVGCMYCPNVTTSTSILRSSASMGQRHESIRTLRP